MRPRRRREAVRIQVSSVRTRRRVKARDFCVAQATRQLHGRQPRGVQDFIRVGVADAAENVRVGQGALERVVLAREPLGERRQCRVEHFEPTGIERAELRSPRRSMCSDACRRDPASVRIAEPVGKSNAASPTLPGIAAPRSRHRSRPAIIRCSTR